MNTTAPTPNFPILLFFLWIWFCSLLSYGLPGGLHFLPDSLQLKSQSLISPNIDYPLYIWVFWNVNLTWDVVPLERSCLTHISPGFNPDTCKANRQIKYESKYVAYFLVYELPQWFPLIIILWWAPEHQLCFEILDLQIHYLHHIPSSQLIFD